MAKSTKIQIEEDLRTQEANRMLSIARRKMETGELLSQHDFPLESAQMYQQAIELSVKAMMVVLIGHSYTRHDFLPRMVEETLRVCREKWPNLFHFAMFVEACSEIANRWSLKTRATHLWIRVRIIGRTVDDGRRRSASEEGC